jgi:hypothetical protein
MVDSSLLAKSVALSVQTYLGKIKNKQAVRGPLEDVFQKQQKKKVRVLTLRLFFCF